MSVRNKQPLSAIEAKAESAVELALLLPTERIQNMTQQSKRCARDFISLCVLTSKIYSKMRDSEIALRITYSREYYQIFLNITSQLT